MLTHYLPVLIFIGLALALSIAPLLIGAVLGRRRPDAEKGSAYECGFPALGLARLPFDVRFYLVAILFIIFDLETAFLFPWAVSLRHIGLFGFCSMLIFLGLLVVGFIFEWKRGALSWE